MAAPPAFPGAFGYGSGATGGRGGPVLHVTSLADSGKGSLRWALQAMSGARIVVFDVGGQINLADEIRVGGNVTVLGQTASGAGVTISGARLSITGSNAILRGLHIRPGRDKGQGRDERDGISVGAKDVVVSDVIVDRNSISWATDENLASWYSVRNVTFSNNIIAEGLLKAGHSEGRHSMGLLVGQTTERVSVLRNLFISNYWRNPQIEATVATEVINNVMINYGPGGILVSQGPSRVDVIGNVLIAGGDTPEVGTRPAIEVKADNAGSAFYIHDNRTPLGMDVAHGKGTGLIVGGRLLKGIAAQDILPSADVLSVVTGSAGARVNGLDPVDSRLIERALAGKAKVVSKAWSGIDWRPEPTGASAADSDADGIPDDDEARIGTDPNVADSHLVDPETGYAFIEIYANGLLPR